MASSWKPNSSARTASFSSVGSSMSSQTNESGRFKASSIWTGSNPASSSRPSTYSLHAMLIVGPRVTHIAGRAGTSRSRSALEQRLEGGIDLRSRHRPLEPVSNDPVLVDDDHPGLRLEPPRLERGRGVLQGAGGGFRSGPGRNSSTWMKFALLFPTVSKALSVSSTTGPHSMLSHRSGVAKATTVGFPFDIALSREM